ncbi:hypothetical protein [Streptomyces antarcticus]|uniref:hypothetical protein n=1 Tax=Streptomyces antarcticus TaxID=2996458 RepID=UPI003B8378DC
MTPLVLHLRPGARQWFASWPAAHHPHLVERYARMYADGSYAPTWYQRQVARQVHEPVAEFGIGPNGPGAARRVLTPDRPVGPPGAPGAGEPAQLALL